MSGILNLLKTDVGRTGSEKGKVDGCLLEQTPGSNKMLMSLKQGSTASRKGSKLLDFPGHSPQLYSQPLPDFLVFPTMLTHHMPALVMDYPV